MENVAKVLEALKRNTEGAEIKGSSNLFVPSTNLSVHVEIGQAEQAKDCDSSSIAVVYFWLEHPSFEDALFETAAALGDTLADALENATKSFFIGIYTSTLEYLSGHFSGSYTTYFNDNKQEWNVVESDLVLMGEQEDNCMKSYLPMISEQLDLHIGNRPLYYIKIYTCKQVDNSIICEVRINDMASAHLAKVLEGYVNSWQNKGIRSQKQFYFLSQKNLQDHYPYTKEEIGKMAVAAAKLFGEYDIDDLFDNEDGESEAREELSKKILHIAKGDKYLAAELQNFMPEMLSLYHFEAPQLESFSINGKTVYTSQITPWHWILTALIDGFQSKALSGQSYSNLINLSSTSSALGQFKEKGEDLSKLRMALAMDMPEGYKVR